MSKNSPTYICSNCDAQYVRWAGRCLECGKWGTIAESTENSGTKSPSAVTKVAAAKTTTLSQIQGESIKRVSTSIGELDRVLGGGLVPGSLILIGGEPGIGKSTLTIQLAAACPSSLLISGEESVSQIKLRADRLKITSPTLELLNETNVERIIATILEKKPTVAIIDSIQTLFSSDAEGEAGSPTQIRATASKLLESLKSTKTATIIVGHVTKEGSVAGPKTLEHLVDTVIYLEGDRHHLYRILRTVKNRFGSTDEIGVFQMEHNGLVEVKNPSAAFLSERGENQPGNVLTCLIEGSRPLLIEVQALVTKTAFGYPTRKSSGFDLNRLHVLIAVLQKRAGLQLEGYDVHINIAGGLTADEPAADLAISLAIASAYKDKALGADLCVFGEVGLGGEVRTIAHSERRIKECEQLGLKRILTNSGKNKITSAKIKILDIKNIQEIIKHT
ncbi:MAG: DNA repair protein RadA [Patescibacteria group bacterium]|jgi:DNA repair protein RadA/Sms